MSVGTVLVSGGSSGLGQAVVAAVAKDGGRPIVLDLAAPESDVEFWKTDLADTRGTERTVREVAEAVGGLDAVVTAGGTDRCGTLADVPGSDWDRVVQVNLLGTAAVVRAALPFLERSSGHVVTVASTLGLRALSDATAYCASKFGIVGFTRALIAETQGRIGVTMLIPGGMQTHFFDGRPEQYKPPADAKLNRPEHVADVVMCALRQPVGCEIREVLVAPSVEGSWP